MFLWAVATSGVTHGGDVDVVDRLSPDEPLDEHALWIIYVLNGEPTTMTDVEARFDDLLLEAVPAEEFLEINTGQSADESFRFEGIVDRSASELVMRVIGFEGA